MIIGNRKIDEGIPHVWGILNVTPDSFSDGGKFNEFDKALFQAEKLIKEGADIIDVGGMSTRPGHQDVSIEEEIDRVCPVIQAITERMDTIISVDTYRSETAAAAARSGAELINDIWGLKFDRNMAEVVASNNLSCCIMHNHTGEYAGDYMTECVKELQDALDIAHAAGIADDRIILDPGIGFGKDYKQNLIMLKEIDRIVDMKYPILLGCSRKSVIGNTLNLPSDEREEGTIATTLWGLSKGIMHYRVHDVKKNMRAIKMWMAIQNA